MDGNSSPNENQNEDFLSRCAQTDFGTIALSRTERAFYERFNGEIISLCKSLPDSVRTDSLLFLLEYSGASLADGVDFFKNYYAPTWSFVFWLGRYDILRSGKMRERAIASAVTSQSMAMLLHSLDDHLTDGQVPVTPLSLLLRSQAWMIMNSAFRTLASGVSGGEETARRLIDAYCWSFQPAARTNDLESYCKIFRKQMAIGMVAPVLLAMKITGSADFARDMEVAYGSFGIAWRLLDDIRDIASDIKAGAHSSIYLCLPKGLRDEWDLVKVYRQQHSKKQGNTIVDFILEAGLIETMKTKVQTELEAAASIAESRNLPGLADQLRLLAYPLRESGTHEPFDKRSNSWLAQLRLS
jgi:hypothetical protein